MILGVYGYLDDRESSKHTYYPEIRRYRHKYLVRIFIMSKY